MAENTVVSKLVPAPRPTVKSVVEAWAAGLIPANAPGTHEKGPLAWVRESKVPELIELLKVVK
jgi:hypothetical protein